MFSDESEKKEKRKVKNPIAELSYSNKAFDFNSRLKKVKKEKRKVKNPIAELLYCNKAFDFNSRLKKVKKRKEKSEKSNC